MLARNAWGVGAALDSDNARLGLLQLAPVSKTSRIAKPIERSPAMFISLFAWQAAIRCPSGGRDGLTRLPLVGRFFIERVPKEGPDTAVERRSLSKCSARRIERLLQYGESEGRVRTVLSFKFVSVKRSRRTGDRRAQSLRHSSFVILIGGTSDERRRPRITNQIFRAMNSAT